ncbi:MAG TPA: PASTA domain-containing protein [Abditibacteriaceae bacterium]
MRGTSGRPATASDNGNSAGARYDVLGRAGEGQTFVVYKVRDRENTRGDSARSNRTLALKALKANFARNPQFAPPLLETADAIAAIDDPNLARIFEVGEEDGTPFVVTEWLPGGSLEDRLRRAPLSDEDARSMTIAIARALDALHRARITHGDLRPKQVLFASNGTPKLCDAGLDAAFAAAGFALADVQQDAAYYFAPERHSATTRATPASDLYSLGVILYRALAGRVPFDGASPLSITQRHRRDVPLAPSQFNPKCSAALESIALRLLEKDPRARYASAQALLRDLESNAASTASPLPATVAAEEFEESPADTRRLPGPVHPDNDDDGYASALSAVGASAVGVSTVAASSTVPVVPAAPTALIDEPPIDHKVARKKQRKREFLGFFLAVFWLIVACALFGGILYGAYYFWKKDTPREVSVPDYRNRTRPEAERLLAARGLKLVVTSEVYDRKRAADTVIKGDPIPGRKVRSGREVFVTVSKGDQPIRMIDLTELDLARARQILARSGMKIGQINEQYHDTVPKGYICGQYPEPGESLTRADPISLIVSRGEQPKDSTGDGETLPLPPEPEAPEAAPLDNGDNPPQTNIDSAPAQTNVSRTVAVRVAIPSGGEAQEVRVDVADKDGERTVYRKIHAPGDLVDESVRVTREQGTKATVRIYVNDELLREQTV